MRFSPLLALLPLAACDFFKDRGDDSNDLYDPGHCEYTPTPIAFDATDAVMGFSPLDWSFRVEGQASTSFVWVETSELTNVTLTLALDHDSFARMDGVWIPPEDGGESGVDLDTNDEQDCPSYLVSDGQWSVVTDDGKINESFSVSVHAEGVGSGGLEASVAFDALNGSYTPSEINPAEWDEVRLDFAQRLGEVFSGTLVLFASREMPGEDGVAEAMQGEVAHWPAE